MAARGNENSLLERILSAAGRTVVLRGPARVGKTAATLAMYRHWLDEFGRTGCLLLAPNAASVAALKRGLLADSNSGVLVGPRVETFSSLAGRVLAAVGDGGKILGDFHRHVLLRRIVDKLAAAGKLSALGAVADTPGLINSLDRSISELKRAAVEPDSLARAIAGRDARSRDLLAVYRSYQQAMHKAGVYDVEGRMWQARDVLSRAAAGEQPLGGLDGISAIAVDGFTDFTPTQLEILAILARWLERVLITLPCGGDARDRMWHWTDRTLARIRRTFGDELAEIAAAPDPAPMRVVWDGLFETDPPAGDWPQQISIIAAAGAEAEVAAVARRVKRLLVDGAAGSIAVLARSLETYRPIVERTFAACDIPIAAGPAPLAGVPVIRFLLDAAAIAPACACRDVLRVIASSYFRPEALGPYGPDHVAAAQMLIREGNVLEGRASYAAAARRLSQRRAARQSEQDDGLLTLGTLRLPPEALHAASEMLEKFFDLVADASGPDGITRLANALQLRQAACQTGQAELIARDLRGLDRLGCLVSDLPDDDLTPARLRAALAATTCPPGRRECLVDVLDVLDARSLRYDHVFLLGVTEGQFPRKFAESSLIREADRTEWRARGLELDSRGDLTAREMLLFYLAVSRAEKALTISCLQSGPSGEPAAPSAFLTAAMEPFGGLGRIEDAGLVERIGLGAAPPPADQLASPREAFNAAISQLLDGQSPDGSAALNWAVRHERERIARCAAGLLARDRRFRPGPVGRFDGRITDPDLLKRLAQAYPHRAVLSAGQFNSYGQCPWQFFASEVLKLRPLAEPTRRLEPVTRGMFVHDVLFRVMTDLRSQADGPLRLHEVGQADLLACLDRAVRAAATVVEATRPPYPALWRIQKDRLAAQLRDYLLSQVGRGQGAEQLCFELGFGLPDAPADALDPASAAEPISIDTAAGQVRIRGKIDRVDRLTGEPDGLFVVDYKTGQLPAKADIDQGRSLQLPIYTAAAEQMLAAAAIGGAFHRIGQDKQMHFSQFKPPRGDGRSFDQRRQAAAEIIGQFVLGMAAGRFDALPTHDCPSYCPFRQACHFSPARAELKAAADNPEGPA